MADRKSISFCSNFFFWVERRGSVRKLSFSGHVQNWRQFEMLHRDILRFLRVVINYFYGLTISVLVYIYRDVFFFFYRDDFFFFLF
jgi:hypothetical protein